MSKRIKMRLPNKLIVFPNADKAFHEKWYKGRNKLNIPHPFRAVCLGPPNSGKGLVIVNILLRAKPQFEEVFCVHCDPEYTKEWDSVGCQMLSEIPNPEDWEGEVKTLVILDDLEYKTMDKVQRRNLDRLFGFVSTHKNVSIILAAQDTFNVPPIVRRCSNLWILWKMQDMDNLSQTARKTGMSAQNFNTIFNELMMDSHDSLWIDTTAKSPYPLRKNGYTLINKTDGVEAKKILDKMDKFDEE
jgi:hypothetical protein